MAPTLGTAHAGLSLTTTASAPGSDEGPREQVVESVVIGTVVFEAALVALRRLAQWHHSGPRFAEAR